MGARLWSVVGTLGLCSVSVLVVLLVAEGVARIVWSAHEKRVWELAPAPDLDGLPVRPGGEAEGPPRTHLHRPNSVALAGREGLGRVGAVRSGTARRPPQSCL